ERGVLAGDATASSRRADPVPTRRARELPAAGGGASRQGSSRRGPRASPPRGSIWVPPAALWRPPMSGTARTPCALPPALSGGALGPGHAHSAARQEGGRALLQESRPTSE